MTRYEPSPEPMVPAPPGPRIRVLLADDCPATRRSVRTFLERRGFEIVGEGADGGEAVRLTRALEPDVAILDIAMPGRSGLDAARDLQRVCPRTHLIALTNYLDEYLIAAARESGIRGYVAKQALAEDLLAAIAEIRAGGTFSSPSIGPGGQESC